MSQSRASKVLSALVPVNESKAITLDEWKKMVKSAFPSAKINDHTKDSELDGEEGAFSASDPKEGIVAVFIPSQDMAVVYDDEAVEYSIK